jgi:hypothetical protein
MPGRGDFDGAALVLNRSGDEWHQQGLLLDPEPGRKSFGDAVAVSGEVALIGAPGRSPVYHSASTRWRCIYFRQAERRMGSECPGTSATTASENGSTDCESLSRSDRRAILECNGRVYPLAMQAGGWKELPLIEFEASFARSISTTESRALIATDDFVRLFRWTEEGLIADTDLSVVHATCEVSISDDRALLACHDGQAMGYAYDLAIGDNMPGEACTLAEECASGFCAEGVCCNRACRESCESCSQTRKADGSPDGVCGTTSAGLRCGETPKGCASRSEYALTGVCDDAGACQPQKVLCPDHRACVGTLASGDCATDCRDGVVPEHSYCAETHWCDDLTGSCVLDRAAGAECRSDEQCESGECAGARCLGKLGDSCAALPCAAGVCVDGVGCNEACQGNCEACDVSGKRGQCSPLPAGEAPHGERSACGGNDPECRGACTGLSGGCYFPDLTARCGEPSCTAGVFVAQVCDGQGSCIDATPARCAPWGCNLEQTSCSDRCSSAAECSAGAACNAAEAQCVLVSAVSVDSFTSRAADGTETSCKPYSCRAAVCLEQCTQDADCAEGLHCDERSCVRHKSDGGCATSGASSSSSRDAGRLLPFLSGLALYTRRSNARRR